MYNDRNSDELKHYGVKGMKWGIRRRLTTTSSNGGSRSGFSRGPIGDIKEKREQKKAQKNLAKSQKAWDDNFNKNWHHAYNKAADIANNELIPKINKKYEKFDFSDNAINKNPELKKTFEKYKDEYNQEFERVLQMEYDKMFGKRPR